MSAGAALAIPELQVTTHFSFLRGASGPEELFAAAAMLGIPALGIVDHGSVAGIVRAWEAARATGVRLVVGTRIDLDEGPSLLLYPQDRPAYARLTRLLTLGKTRGGKGACRLGWDDLPAWSEGLDAILVTDLPDHRLSGDLVRLRAVYGERASCALTRRFRPDDHVHLADIAEAARQAGVATVATGDVLYHAEERRVLQDVVTCIRLGVTIDDAGFRLERHADRHLKPPAETARLFARHPEALERAREIAGRCRFDLGELRYQYPHEVVEEGRTAQETLARLTWSAMAEKHGSEPPEAEARQARHELALIEKLGYAPYFLTVHAIVRAARSMEPPILCQGRGSAANSLVCYLLGITAVDPMQNHLLFERFLSAERHEPPDIDVDFEHERREEVIQWVYRTYGLQRSALCATVIRYGARGAVREVGKVFGVPEDLTGALSGLVWGWSREGVGEREVQALGLDLTDRRLRMTLALARELINTPRHLSQHPGGFVLTEDRLDELVPIEPASMKDRQVIEWDKDDIDALKFMKVDVLGLGMLGAMRRAFDLLERHRPDAHRTLATIPQDDPATYDMICRADTLGTFQIESRAQMAMLPRHKPRRLYDLVIQVAVVRPGPIQGDMVHPYLRRREGKEKVEYPTPELEGVLGKTLGIPLFQEQAMQVAIVCAGFTPGEADQLRRAMATFKQTGGVSGFREKMIAGMVARNYDRTFAEKTFKQIEGFGSYGFPESHAASFALIAYASAWVKHHHPDIFLAALLNAQPMGFYAPAQLVRDARDHGVEVLPPDVNLSSWDTVLEERERRDGPAGHSERRHREGLADNRTLHAPHPEVLGGAEPRRTHDGGACFEGRLWRPPQHEERGSVRPSSEEPALQASRDGRACFETRPMGAPQHDAGESFQRADQANPDRLPVRLGLRLAKGLSEEHGQRIVERRADGPYASLEELWRRAAVPVQALSRLAEADAFGSLGLDRRGASWLIRGLRDDPLPLFAAADRREDRLAPEIIEERPALRPMADGRQVVEDYRSRGLTLRQHPVSFLRGALARRRAVPCSTLLTARDGRRLTIAGLVLVRQKPGSAKGTMFITLEDETEVANLVVWASVFEQHRRLILSASMMACKGRVQRAGRVVHVVAEELIDLSPWLHRIGRDEAPFIRTGRGDEAKHGGAPDARDGVDAVRAPRGGASAPIAKGRDLYAPDVYAKLRPRPRAEPATPSPLRVKTRDFR